ncbi:MAG: SAM-dependent methyltransferase [Thiomicrospira sp.]|jgi:SAM-dependent MidA family methyltransferase|nr:SAM-dependent methyltransferase [Thiomicrospira sp.]
MTAKPNKALPEPNDNAKQRSVQLSDKIRRHLHRHGQLTFAQFMQLTLYTPGLGYYANGLPKIGAEGDFITAPEISPLFSRCIARQTQQVLSQLSTPNIIEFGAGRGIMARDILLELERLNVDFEHYFIIELSGDLKQIQQQTLQSLPAHLAQKVVWLDQLPSRPLQAVVLANEVLDAMPVERIKLEPAQQSHAYVVWNEQTQQFDWQYQPITQPALQRFANQLLKHIGEPAERGYHTEVNLHIAPWLQSISDFLSAGLVLLIDYGYPRHEYYQPARHMGTLRCHYQHRAHSNPFFYPGLQDITAHVDFTAVAEAAFDAKFKVAGYTTQAHFLMASGLLEMAEQPKASVTEQLKIAQQIKTLTLPNEMGENFKVIALSKQLDLPLIGFKLRDLRRQL